MNAVCTPDRCDTCPGRVVCRCLQVTEEEVVTMIATLGLRTVHEVKRATGAGDGCTCCHDDIRKQLQMVNSLAVAG
jgi:bacterioferritin-associated ferredoxin